MERELERIKHSMNQYNLYYDSLDDDYIDVKAKDFARMNPSDRTEAIKSWAEVCEDEMLDKYLRNGANSTRFARETFTPEEVRKYIDLYDDEDEMERVIETGEMMLELKLKQGGNE